MADDDAKGPPPPIGVVLMENLTKALIDCTSASILNAQTNKELIAEIKTLREDLEGVGGISGDVCGHLTTFLRILDHVATSSLERPPKWKDVQDILQEIKDELQQEEQEEQEEEEQEPEGPQRGESATPPVRGTSEIFPRKIVR